MPRHTRAWSARWLVAIGLIGVCMGTPGTAHAFWSGAGEGTAQAAVAHVTDPGVTAASPDLSDRVELSWTPPDGPSGMTLLGYRVNRVVGTTRTPICGTGPSSLLASGTTSCTDASLADGSYGYEVIADLGTWTATGVTPVPVTVAADRTGPAIALAGADPINAIIAQRSGSDRLFFRPGAPGGGSVAIDATVTDDGVGPASASFPSVGAAGWTHASETVTTGSGAEPSITYRSSTFTFAQGASTPGAITITAADDRGNTSTAALAFVADSSAPGGGAVTVNGSAATLAGTTSNATGDFTVSLITPYAENPTATTAGLGSVELVRESAPLSANACGTFGGAESLPLTAPIAQAGLSDGCYRYTLTGVDLVGNSASVRTTVKLDRSAPTGGAVTANGTAALPGGATSTSTVTSWPLLRTDFTDAETGMTSSVLTRTSATLTGGACGTFGGATTLTGTPTQSGLTTGCYRYTMVGTNAFALQSTISVTVQVDTVLPTGGAVSVNGTAASSAGPKSNNNTGTVVVSGLANYTDANIGIATSTLVRAYAPLTAGVCGAYDSGTEVTGNGTLTGLEDGCHRFTLTGVDLAGNTNSISTVVWVDTTAPADGTLVVNAVDGSSAGTLSWSPDNAWDAVWSHFTDPESGVTSVSLARSFNTLAAGSCAATWGTATNLVTALTPSSGTTAQTAMTSGRCWRYVLTGTNAVGLSSTLTAIVREDNVGPTTLAGSLTVNGSTASSTSITGTYAVTAVRTYQDAQSGMASTTLTRTWAPVSANVCGTADPATTVDIGMVVPINETALPVGCYTYRQTALNQAGSQTLLSVTVRVDNTAPTGGALTANGTAAANVATQSYNGTGAWTVDSVPFADSESVPTNTIARSVATTLTNGTCSTFGTAVNTTITGPTTTSESGLTAGCIRYILTGRNSLNLTAPTLSTIVRIDTSAPAGGAMTVNGTAATLSPGSSSTSATGTFSISARTAMTDGQSTIASSSLTRTSGPTCATLDPASAITYSGNTSITETTLAPGCYRYEFTSTNGAGLSRTISSSVTVGP